MKNLLLALSSGFLLALSWPTYGFPLLLFVAFVPLLFVTRNIHASKVSRKNLKVFGFSYISFFIFNIITSYWLYYSTAFGMWFAVLANSLLMSLVWQCYNYVNKRVPQLPALVFLASFWMLFEWMHLHWEFSWPWLNLGNGFASYTSWIQWYEYTGSFGGSLWVWVANIMLFMTLSNRDLYKSTTKAFYRNIGIYLSLIILPILLSIGIKANYKITEDPVEVVLLQPNIDPYTEKYNTTNERIADLLFRDARKVVTPNTRYLIAPETVLAQGYGVQLDNFSYSREKIKAQNFLKEYPKLNYLTGIQFYNFHKSKNELLPTSNYLGTDRLGDSVWGDFYNSAVLLDRQDTSQIYHKSKLVVGVENFPYQSTLKPLLGDIMIDLGGTVSMKTKQEDRTVFQGNDASQVAPIICYESVYGAYVTDYVKNGAQFLAIITNDAWWGNTQGHKQHLNYARIRAIENRRSVARSANTGISAFIDQTGRIQKQLAYGSHGTLRGTVDKNDKLTFYSKNGNYIPKIAIFPAVIILLFSIFRKKDRSAQ